MEKERIVPKVNRYESQKKITDRSHEGYGKHKQWKETNEIYSNFQDLLPFNPESKFLLLRLKPMNSQLPATDFQLDLICKIFRLFNDFKFVREVNI